LDLPEGSGTLARGAVTQRLSSFAKTSMSSNDLLVSDDCPEAEQIRPRNDNDK